MISTNTFENTFFQTRTHQHLLISHETASNVLRVPRVTDLVVVLFTGSPSLRTRPEGTLLTCRPLLSSLPVRYISFLVLPRLNFRTRFKSVLIEDSRLRSDVRLSSTLFSLELIHSCKRWNNIHQGSPPVMGGKCQHL